MKLEVVSTPALKRQAKRDLVCLMVYMSALLGWLWLAMNYVLPVVLLCLVSLGLVTAFVRSFERCTSLENDLLMDITRNG